jgi:hypothetical protein
MHNSRRSILLAVFWYLAASPGGSVDAPESRKPAPPPQAPLAVGNLPAPVASDVMTAIHRAFDERSKGIAETVEAALSAFGTPSAYVTDADISGAVIVGGRYGSGMLYSAVAPPVPVKWRALSLGVGLGANHGRVVMLVYGLDALDDLFGLYASLEGNAHLVAGANATLMTRGDVTIVFVSSGLGLRLSGDLSGISIEKDGGGAPPAPPPATRPPGDAPRSPRPTPR